MNDATEDRAHAEHLDPVADALGRDAVWEVRELLGVMHPADIALLLESLPLAERSHVWDQLDPTRQAEVFAEADDAVRAPRMREMDPRALAAIAHRGRR